MSISTRDIALPLHEARGWIKFLAILNILSGAMSCLTLLGLLWGWLPILQGVLLLKAGKEAEQAWIADDSARLQESLRRLKTYFIISGVAILVSSVVSTLGVMGILGVGVIGGLGVLNSLL